MLFTRMAQKYTELQSITSDSETSDSEGTFYFDCLHCEFFFRGQNLAIFTLWAKIENDTRPVGVSVEEGRKTGAEKKENSLQLDSRKKFC
jgi:hypothetical protein